MVVGNNHFYIEWPAVIVASSDNGWWRLNHVNTRLHALIVRFLSTDRAEQPLNLHNGKLPFTIHYVPLA